MVDSSIEQLNAHRQECLCYGSFSANRKERVTAKKLKPVHPGEILREEFMAPLELSMNKMAMALRVPVTRIADIVNEPRGITADAIYTILEGQGIKSTIKLPQPAPR